MKGKTTKIDKKETDTEMLARLMVNGFDGVNKRLDGVDKRLDGVDKRLGSLETDVSSLKTDMSYVKQELVSINLAQDETNHRLTSIERKQTGLLESIDETVHKKEFQVLVSRVRILEGKR